MVPLVGNFQGLPFPAKAGYPIRRPDAFRIKTIVFYFCILQKMVAL